MAAITVLGPGGYPRRAYGSFAGKTAGGRMYTQQFTVLSPGGYPRPPYSTALFATKTTVPPVTGQYTVSGLEVHDRFPVFDVVYTQPGHLQLITRRTN